MLTTQLTQQLGLTAPIISAGMAFVAHPPWLPLSAMRVAWERWVLQCFRQKGCVKWFNKRAN
jgi:hypothetical protein